MGSVRVEGKGGLRLWLCDGFSLLLLFVGQDGCLAVIWWLLALNDCLCLRNGSRISYTGHTRVIHGLKLWVYLFSGTNRNKQQHGKQ